MQNICDTEITQDFLETQGYTLIEDVPFGQTYTKLDYKLRISSYGGFTISNHHWCNHDEIDQIISLNRLVKKTDFIKVMKLLGLEIIK